MSLRTKIALGMLAIPGIVASVLVIVIVIGIRNEARSIQQTNIDNTQTLRDYHDDLSQELGQAWLLVTRNWVDGNLSIHNYRKDREAELVKRLRQAVIFRSVSLVKDIDQAMAGNAAPAQIVKHEGKSLAKEISEPLPPEQAAIFSKLKTKMALAQGNIIYRRYYYFDPDRTQPSLDMSPDLLLRFEMVASAKTPPSPQLAEIGLNSIIQDMLWTIGIGAIVMTLVITWTVRRFVLRPLDKLLGASRRVATGDYSSPISGHSGQDEMAELVRTFNMMQQRMGDYQLDMESKVLDAADRIHEQERSLVVAQRLAATGTLAAGLAHEINNPLGGMLNALRRIKDKSDDSQQLEYLELIDEGLARIKTLMGQILNFSRGRDSAPERFDVARAINKSVEFVQYRFDDQRRLVVSVADHLPDVFGDATSLGQVIINLLLNARDALKDNKGTVEIQVKAENATVVIEVRDDGEGMDEQTHAHIFDPFFTTKGPGKGTGLGLTIVHTVISNHDGTISVESEPNKGTTFTIRIPGHASREDIAP